MRILKFFDKLEDKIRHFLSHTPIIYALVGIIGIALAWRGVWHLADAWQINPVVSFLIGILILLATGLLVAVAIGDEIIITAFRGRKKITEVKLEETLSLAEKVDDIKNLLEKIDKNLGNIKKEEKEIEKEIEKNI